MWPIQTHYDMTHQGWLDQLGELYPSHCLSPAITTGEVVNFRFKAICSMLFYLVFMLSIVFQLFRYYYSYKIGYIPRIQMRKIFKAMKSRVQFILTPHNGKKAFATTGKLTALLVAWLCLLSSAQWERLSPSDLYVIGKPMYFQAEARSLDLSEDERLYVHSCHATPNKSHSSMPQFPVVENFG